MKIQLSPDQKYGLEIFWRYFPLFSSTVHLPDPAPTPKVITSCPLSIGMPSFPAGLKLAKIGKKEKLKNRDLMQNPYII
jgi:hypothetical protein